MSEYSAVTVGKPDTHEYKVYLKGPKGIVSSVHDIPLKPEGSPKNVFNMVVEVPRWSNAKLEVSLLILYVLFSIAGDLVYDHPCQSNSNIPLRPRKQN